MQILSLKLARIVYQKMKNFLAAIRALDLLGPEKQTGKEYFLMRATIADKQGRDALALGYYKKISL